MSFDIKIIPSTGIAEFRNDGDALLKSWIQQQTPALGNSLEIETASGYNGHLLLQRTSGNNVGIGVTEGQAVQKLTVGGNVLVLGTASVYNSTFSESAANTSGFAGAGWKIDYDGLESGKSTAVFDNLTVRGTMRIYELLINQIRATNGSIFVSSTGKVHSVNPGTWTGDIGADGSTYDFSTETNTNHGFQTGDIIRAQRFTGAGVYQINMLVTSTPVTLTTFTATMIGDNTAYILSIDDFVDVEFVRLGNVSDVNRQGSVYMSADDDGAPFIDVIDGITSHSDWNSFGMIKARLGNLEGVSDATFGTLEGYGLYSQNIYLTGNAQIAGTLTAGDANGVGNTFYAGQIKTNVAKNSNGTSEWSSGYGTVSFDTGTANPFGENGVVKIVSTTTKQRRTINSDLNFQTNNDFTVSFWAKKSTGSTAITIDTNDRTVSATFSITSEWQRFSFQATSHSGLDGAYNFVDLNGMISGDILYFYGFQVEIGLLDTPSSYQPTGGVLATESGYGMWAIAGGFGGTIQNPALKLSNKGFLTTGDNPVAVGKHYDDLASQPNNSIYVGNWNTDTGVIINKVDDSNYISNYINDTTGGILGVIGGETSFHLNLATAGISQIAGWTFNDTTLEANPTTGEAGSLISLRSEFNARPTMIIGWGNGTGTSETSGHNHITLGGGTLLRSANGQFLTTGWLYDGGGLSINIDDKNIFFAGKRGSVVGAAIAGWNFNTNKMWSGGEYQTASGIELSSLNSRLLIYKGSDTHNIVNLYYQDESNWGIYGRKDNVAVFQLGSTNQIAGWTFDSTKLSNGSVYVSSGFDVPATGDLTYFGKNSSGNSYLIFKKSDKTVVIENGLSYPTLYINDNTYIRAVLGNMSTNWNSAGDTYTGIGIKIFDGNDGSLIFGNVSNTEIQLSGWTAGATTLSSGNIILDSGNDKITIGTTTTYNTETTWFYVDNAGQMSLGDSLTFSAGDLTISGTVYASAGSFSGNISALSGNIGDWILADGTLVSENGVITLDSANAFIKLEKDSDDYIDMYYTSDTDWGIIGKNAGNTYFQLGYTNSIAGWTFGNTYLRKDDGVGIIELDSSNKSIRIWKDSDTSHMVSMGKLYYKGAWQDGWGFSYTSNYNDTGHEPEFTVGSLGNKIAGWTFDQTRLISTVSGRSIVISNDSPWSAYETNALLMYNTSSGPRIWLRRDLTSYVGMYYSGDSDWGFKGQLTGDEVFQLGSTNQIAGWTFDVSALYVGTKTVSAGYAANVGDLTISPTTGISAKNFYIDAAGNAKFKGDITGASGTIGGITLDTGGIYGTNFAIDTDGLLTANVAAFTGSATADVFLYQLSGSNTTETREQYFIYYDTDGVVVAAEHADAEFAYLDLRGDNATTFMRLDPAGTPTVPIAGIYIDGGSQSVGASIIIETVGTSTRFTKDSGGGSMHSDYDINFDTDDWSAYLYQPSGIYSNVFTGKSGARYEWIKSKFGWKLQSSSSISRMNLNDVFADEIHVTDLYAENMHWTGDPSVTINLDNVVGATASRAIVSNAFGVLEVSATNATQIGYLSTVSSNVQTQFGTKANLAGAVFTGNVSVGNTPNTGYNFRVLGSARFDYSSIADPDATTTTNHPAHYWFTSTHATSGIMTLAQGSGSNTGTILTLADEGGARSTFNYLQMSIDTNGIDLPHFTFRGDGKLGIGTSNPTVKLHVTDDSTSLVGYFVNNDTTNGYGVAINAGGTASTRYAFRVRSVSATDTYLTIQTETGKVGFVGIGTSSPEAKLHVTAGGSTDWGITSTPSAMFGEADGNTRGYLKLWGKTPGTYGVVQMTSGNLHLDSSSSGILYLQHYSQKATVANIYGGNFGIGTSSPDYTLQVNGTIAPETTGQDLGTTALRWDLYGTIINVNGIFTSTVAIGTSPFIVTSTTVVANLNADLWDGNQFASYLNQALLTTSSPTFNNLTLSGNLNISGGLDQFNVTNLNVKDKTITLNDGGTTALSDGGGLLLEGDAGATVASILYNNTDSTWDLSIGLDVAGTSTFSNDMTLATNKKFYLHTNTYMTAGSDSLSVYFLGNRSLWMSDFEGSKLYSFGDVSGGTGRLHLTPGSNLAIEKVDVIIDSNKKLYFGPTSGNTYMTTVSTTSLDTYYSGVKVLSHNATTSTFSGFVGIGTTAPTDELHVWTDQNTGTQIRVQNDTIGTGANSRLVLESSLGEGHLVAYSEALTNLDFAGKIVLYSNGTGNDIKINTRGNGDIEFAIQGDTTEHIMTTAGLVGIGTIGPRTILDIVNGSNNVNADLSNVVNIVGPDVIGNSANLAVTTNSTQAINMGGSISLGGRYTSTGQAHFARIKAGKEDSVSGQYGGYLSLYTRIHGSPLAERIRIQPNGNVGVGILAPISKFHIYEDSSNTGITAGMTIEQDGAGDAVLQFLLTSASRWAMGIDNSDGDKFKIASTNDLNTDARFTIDSVGNIGIGRTNPLDLLHIYYGETSDEKGLLIQSYAPSIKFLDLSTGQDAYQIVVNANNFSIKHDSDEDGVFESTRFIINSAGNLGIGTDSPDVPFHVESTEIYIAKFKTTGTSNQVVVLEAPTGYNTNLYFYESSVAKAGIRWDGGNDKLLFKVGDVAIDALTILDNGKVGIGTIAPGYMLEVNGTFRVVGATTLSSTLTVTGNITGNLIGNATSVTSSPNRTDAAWYPVVWNTIGGTSPNYTCADITIQSSTGTLHANKLTAFSKEFLIPHPTKEGMTLRYGSLESPYHGVRLTGEAKVVNGVAVVMLPDYITGLCTNEGSQVMITNIRHSKTIYVELINVNEHKFVVMCDDLEELSFYWAFTAVRKDVDPIVVEA